MRPLGRGLLVGSRRPQALLGAQTQLASWAGKEVKRRGSSRVCSTPTQSPLGMRPGILRFALLLCDLTLQMVHVTMTPFDWAAGPHAQQIADDASHLALPAPLLPGCESITD